MQKPDAYAAAKLLLAFSVLFSMEDIARAQIGMTAPGPNLHPTDIFSDFALPAFQNGASSELSTALGGLQVGHRALALHLDGTSALNAWQGTQMLLNRISPVTAPHKPGTASVFSGTSASELNGMIADTSVESIRIDSEALTIDQPIEVRRSNLNLDLGTVQISDMHPPRYMLRIEGASNVAIQGGTFAAGDSAILVSNSAAVTIGNTRIDNLPGAGIVVTGSAGVNITGNTISTPGLAGIMIHRGTTQSVVQQNQIVSGTGFSNLAAGIVLTDREVDLTTNPRAIFGPDGYWVITQPITERMNPPHDNLVAWNTVTGGLASGVYSDGAVRNVIFGNVLRGNSKEGLCLDNGTTSTVVAWNTIQDNGRRWGDPDSVLSLDSILAGGRLADGTAAEKVPGISLDNAAYNLVLQNDVAHNFGGGVKIVRTGYFNAIGLNTLVSNNDGAGPVFHFFGVELGAASGSSPELDFTPSRGNLVFSNSIRGTHYSGVFFDAGSSNNTVLFNSILDAKAWALESASQMINSSVNNLTNLASRNIGSGLDQSLIISGQPVNDPPPQ